MEWHSVLLLLALHTCVASSFIAPGAPQCKSRAHSFLRDGHQKRKLDPVALDQPRMCHAQSRKVVPITEAELQAECRRGASRSSRRSHPHPYLSLGTRAPNQLTFSFKLPGLNPPPLGGYPFRKAIWFCLFVFGVLSSDFQSRPNLPAFSR
jgi:hypothetical protein